MTRYHFPPEAFPAMQGHTPGPWAIGYDPDNGRPLEILALHRDHRVAFLASDGREADAHLIAAAPELLAALKFITEQMREPGCSGHSIGAYLLGSGFAMAIEAIAKAEGKP